MLHWHGDDVEAYYDGDEQVQVVAGAHLVDEKAGGGVIRVVGLTLSFCWKWEMVGGSWGEGRGEEEEEEEKEKEEVVMFRKWDRRFYTGTTYSRAAVLRTGVDEALF